MADAVAHLHAPWVTMNETSTLPLTPPLSVPILSTGGPQPPLMTSTATKRTNSTLNPVKAGVSLEGTSVVSIFYVPTGSQTTLMVATGEPSSRPSVPLAGYRTLTDAADTRTTSTAAGPTLVAATDTPTRSGSVTASASATDATTTDAADSGARANFGAAPLTLVWGCMIVVATALGHGLPVL